MQIEPFLPFPNFTKIDDQFDRKNNILLHCGDSKEFLKTIPDEYVTLIITSPPYNIGKEYETKTAIDVYLQTQAEVIKELIRILKPEGSICWEVGNYVEESEVFPLDIFFYDLFKKEGLKLRNRIIWHFGHGLHCSKRFSGRYETILWFTKGDVYTFNLDPVRVPSKYPGKRHYKGKNYGKPSGNPLGKNPSDIWEIVIADWEEEIWEIPNVKSNHPEKTIHPCQFPIELVERCVLALTNKGDFVLDPYAGVGSSLIAALRNDRCAIGIDKEPKYIEIAEQRIKQFYTGNLRVRELGTPIHKPTGKEKVSQVPEEWFKEENE
jgi:adenine-specific DNA-methyltransferase